MKLQGHAHYWARGTPDWLAAVVAGLAASALLMVLELFWSASLGGLGPWVVSRKVAAIVMGPQVLQSSVFGIDVVLVALLTHYVLGIFSGVMIGIIIAGFHFEISLGMMQLIGAVFGTAVYLVNFYALGQIFPWFGELRGWSAWLGHLAFGVVAALIYWKLSRQKLNI